jgi:hypothetical protein
VCVFFCCLILNSHFIGSCESIGIWGLSPSQELIDAQRRACAALETHFGVSVVRVAPFARMSRAIEIWSTLLQEAEDQSFSDRLYGAGNGGLLRNLKELLLFSVGWSHHTLPAIGLALLEGITRLLATESRVKSLNVDANMLECCCSRHLQL